MYDFTDKSETNEGTPLDRYAMLAVQGFIPKTITFEGDKIIEENEKGQKLTTTFDGNVITETFDGEKKASKITTLSGNTIIEDVNYS